MIQSRAFLVLLFFSLCILHATEALSAHNVRVSPVQSHTDIVELGTLRYQEWMLDEPPETRPSLMAFRMATAEMQRERMAQKAVAFLARLDDDDQVVGTAELSCMELQGCYSTDDRKCRYLYVTDVVTARAHRRKGIAVRLMEAIESHALQEETSNNDEQSTVLLLHVEHENEAALGFYQALGYDIVVSEEESLEGLDVDRLAENAGVSGQLLLCKTLPRMAPTTGSRKKKSKKKAARGGGRGRGFGR